LFYFFSISFFSTFKGVKLDSIWKKVDKAI